MKKLVILGALLVGSALGLQDFSSGHGGTYRGPGDTVPPGGGGGGGGGGPTTPGPNGPSGPGPSGPTTPGNTGPPAPGGGGPAQPLTPGATAGTDRTTWEFWWGFNKDPYLNLKAHIHQSSVITGSDTFFLGHGMTEQAKDSMRPSKEMIRNLIVPALIRSLETETSNDIITGAMIALAKIGDEQTEDGKSVFEELIRPFLSAGSQEVAETAAVALGILGNPNSVDTLIHLIRDDDVARHDLVKSEAGVTYRTRAFAAYGLGQIGTRTEDVRTRQKIVNVLWELCESPRFSTRDIKVASVIAMGLVPLDPEVMTAAGTEQEYQSTSEPPTTRQEQISYLLDFLEAEKDKNKRDLVRAHAPRAIVQLMKDLSDTQLKDRVVAALKGYVGRGAKGTKELRQSAILAFGQLGGPGDGAADTTIRERLMQGSKVAGDQASKNFSLIALGQVGAKLGDDEVSRKTALEIRKYLILQVKRGNSGQRPWAGLAIGIMEHGARVAGLAPSAESLLVLREELARSRAKREVGAYAIGLGIAGDQYAEPFLLDKFENLSDDDARGYTAVALGLINSVDSKETIQRVVKDSKYRAGLLKQAAIALGLLGDQEIVPSLTRMLEEEAKTLSSQAAIASALGFIGDHRSVDSLVAMLENDDLVDAARGFAAVALGIVADKEPLPWNSKFSVDINYLANTETLTGQGLGLLDIL